MSWEAPKDLGNPEMDGYFVEFREVGADSWLDAGELDGTSATIGWLENEVEYEVRVAVFNIHGNAITGPKRATLLGGVAFPSFRTEASAVAVTVRPGVDRTEGTATPCGSSAQVAWVALPNRCKPPILKPPTGKFAIRYI